MSKIKIFSRWIEEDDDDIKELQKTANRWLEKNPKISIDEFVVKLKTDGDGDILYTITILYSDGINL